MNRNVEIQRAHIAKLNDQFRSMALDVLVTQGVMHGVKDVTGLLKSIERFDDFHGDNDPYDVHDFGLLQWNGEKIYWKIDYYESEYQLWCDPLSPECKRVMTVMLASEY